MCFQIQDGYHHTYSLFKPDINSLRKLLSSFCFFEKFPQMIGVARGQTKELKTNTDHPLALPLYLVVDQHATFHHSEPPKASKNKNWPQFSYRLNFNQLYYLAPKTLIFTSLYFHSLFNSRKTHIKQSLFKSLSKYSS